MIFYQSFESARLRVLPLHLRLIFHGGVVHAVLASLGVPLLVRARADTFGHRPRQHGLVLIARDHRGVLRVILSLLPHHVDDLIVLLPLVEGSIPRFH